MDSSDQKEQIVIKNFYTPARGNQRMHTHATERGWPKKESSKQLQSTNYITYQLHMNKMSMISRSRFLICPQLFRTYKIIRKKE